MQSIHELLKIKRRTDYSCTYFVAIYNKDFSLSETYKLWRNIENTLSFMYLSVDQRVDNFLKDSNNRYELDKITKEGCIDPFNYLAYSCDTTGEYYV